MASQDWFEKDFYAVLGVPTDAEQSTIKKAYRKLVRANHPDTKPGDVSAEQRFKDIGEAYGVLSDAEQRQQYDAIRQMSRGGARFTAGGPGGAANGGFEDVFGGLFNQGGGQRVRFETRGGGGQPDLEDLLSGMFAGQGGYPGGGYSGYGAPSGPRRGADVNARTSIPFRQAAIGDTVTLSTADGGRVTTRIPAGVKDGQKIRLRGKGSPGDPGGTPGDLMLTVQVEHDPVFGRDGDNLTVDLPVTFAEAALGATVGVPTLDGQTVKVRIAPGTPSGRVLRVKGRGIATKSHTGDLLAKVGIIVPQRLSDAAKAAVEMLRDEDGQADPRAELYAKARG